jgi:hypothetical protein
LTVSVVLYTQNQVFIKKIETVKKGEGRKGEGKKREGGVLYFVYAV